VDAIASAGFRMSRSKLADLVKKGDVRINWLPCTKPSVIVQEGDVISVQGKGRMTVGSVSTTTKGKYSVHLSVML
jgi:RNA-binding protein YlmH